MIPRSQHFGDRAPFPCHWSGVVRVFEEPVLERFLDPAGSRAHYPGEQANASVEQHDGGRLAAGEDDVADADLLDPRAGFEQAFVEALEPAAEGDDAGTGSEQAAPRLGGGGAG